MLYFLRRRKLLAGQYLLRRRKLRRWRASIHSQRNLATSRSHRRHRASLGGRVGRRFFLRRRKLRRGRGGRRPDRGRRRRPGGRATCRTVTSYGGASYGTSGCAPRGWTPQCIRANVLVRWASGAMRGCATTGCRQLRRGTACRCLGSRGSGRPNQERFPEPEPNRCPIRGGGPTRPAPQRAHQQARPSPTDSHRPNWRGWLRPPRNVAGQPGTQVALRQGARNDTS